jgi:polyhydroxyalkanoate synthesis regulator phasin
MSIITKSLIEFSTSQTTLLDPASKQSFEVLLYVESMNAQVVAELTRTQDLFKTLLEDTQKTLNATLQENLSLKKEIIQLNTIIKENELVHAQEVKTYTEAIHALTGSVNELQNDLKSTKEELNNNFKGLANHYNVHTHTTNVAKPLSSYIPYGSSKPTTQYNFL